MCSYIMDMVNIFQMTTLWLLGIIWGKDTSQASREHHQRRPAVGQDQGDHPLIEYNCESTYITIKVQQTWLLLIERIKTDMGVRYNLQDARASQHYSPEMAYIRNTPAATPVLWTRCLNPRHGCTRFHQVWCQGPIQDLVIVFCARTWNFFSIGWRANFTIALP